jgi:hypothetical protein
MGVDWRACTTAGSAETNICLHQQVMEKFAESGGKMQESLARLIVDSVPR